MNNCYMTTTDSVRIHVYNEEEVKLLFGKDYLEDYGQELPEDLLKRYKNCLREFWNIQEELDKYYLKGE